MKPDENKDSNRYDVIVIGSGMGGLTTASLLASVGKKKVLVLESHFKLGGFTHSFRRQDFEWDAGVHYVGEMHPKAMSRKIMDLVTNKSVQWSRLGDTVERYYFPQVEFDVASDPKTFQADLIARFPQEAAGIRQVFRDISKMQGWSTRWFIGKTLPNFLAKGLTWWGLGKAKQKTQEYLDSVIKDERLKAILTGQWPDFGTPPQQSSWAIHATVMGDFLHGAYYPIGGAKTIAAGAQRVIESNGGKCLVHHPVSQIVVEQGRAVGVQVQHKGQTLTFLAPTIVSNAGVYTTYSRLLAPQAAPREQQQLSQVQLGPSAIILFLGLNDDPRKHGFDDANYWVYNSLDASAIKNPERDPLTNIQGTFLSFGSLRNPEQTAPTAQLISFSEYERWGQFSGSRWMKRGPEYEAQKQRVADAMIDFACERFPQLRKLIAYQELSTPLSVETFTSHRGGMVYGQACTPERLFEHSWKVKSSLPGLYLTGSDPGLPGVNGAMMGGVMTAAKILGWSGFPRIFTAAYSQ